MTDGGWQFAIVNGRLAEIFFDDTGKITERLTPKKGRLVWWKGRIFHAKSSPTKSINRLVLNFNLLPIKEIK